MTTSPFLSLPPSTTVHRRRCVFTNRGRRREGVQVTLRRWQISTGKTKSRVSHLRAGDRVVRGVRRRWLHRSGRRWMSAVSVEVFWRSNDGGAGLRTEETFCVTELIPALILEQSRFGISVAEVWRHFLGLPICFLIFLVLEGVYLSIVICRFAFWFPDLKRRRESEWGREIVIFV